MARKSADVADSCRKKDHDETASLTDSTSTRSMGKITHHQSYQSTKCGEGGDKVTSIDDVIEYLGVGKFQYVTLLVLGLCFASDAVEVTMLSFLSPTLKAEWNLEPWQSSTITSVVFSGALIGALLFGRLGDIIGRRPTFLCLAFTLSVFGFATAFVNDFVTLLCIRFAVGVGVGGMVVVFDFVAEFLPSSSRGRYLMTLEYFWTVGAMLVPLVASVTLAFSWRLFVLFCSIPCFTSAVVGYFLLPESPRWLAAKGRTEEAREILQRIAVMNGKDPSVLTHVQVEEEEEESCDVRDLFKPSRRLLTLAIWGIWAGFGFCYYGLIIVTTRVFESGDDALEDCEGETDCSNGGDELNFDFMAIFFTASAELVGNAIVIGIIDRVGRVPSLIAGYAGGGIAIAMLCWMVGLSGESKSYGMLRPWMVAFAYVARACETIGTDTTYVITAELMPTEVRTTGHSVANAVSRVGGFCSPYVVRGNLSFGWIGGILLLVHIATAFLCAQLPETSRRHLVSMNSKDDDKTIGPEGFSRHQSAHDTQ